jgi:hypothetical protein
MSCTSPCSQVPSPVPGYEYACCARLDDEAENPLPPLGTPGKTLVFPMPKPDGWDEMGDDEKWARKRAHLEHVYGACLCFLEDHDATHLRAIIDGIVVVYAKDYYAEFEIANYPNAESLSVASSWCLGYTSSFTKEQLEEQLDIKNLRMYEHFMQERNNCYQQTYRRLWHEQQQRIEERRRALQIEQLRRQGLLARQLPYTHRFRIARSETARRDDTRS